MPLRNDTRMYIWHHMTPYDTIWHHKWHQDEGICREYRKSRIRSLTVAIGALKCWTPACSDLKNLQTLQWISCLILHQFNNWLQSNVHCRITDVQCFLMFSLYFVCRAIAHDVSPVEMFFQYVATDKYSNGDLHLRLHLRQRCTWWSDLPILCWKHMTIQQISVQAHIELVTWQCRYQNSSCTVQTWSGT